MTLPPPTRPISVLLVEDHRDIAFSLACFFRLGAGYDVRVATDGAEGVRFALASPPDVVVCDIGLPKQNGLLVAEELAERLPRRPLFIAVSGYGDLVTRDCARAAGFDHFLVKPADPFALQDLIEAHARPAGAAAGWPGFPDVLTSETPPRRGWRDTAGGGPRRPTGSAKPVAGDWRRKKSRVTRSARRPVQAAAIEGITRVADDGPSRRTRPPGPRSRPRKPRRPRWPPRRPGETRARRRRRRRRRRRAPNGA